MTNMFVSWPAVLSNIYRIGDGSPMHTSNLNSRSMVIRDGSPMDTSNLNSRSMVVMKVYSAVLHSWGGGGLYTEEFIHFITQTKPAANAFDIVVIVLLITSKSVQTKTTNCSQ